jgi:hypothetical protein
LKGVALLCALLAVFNFLGPIGAFALLLLVLSIVAHVSGNALGMRLRDCGDRPVDDHDRPLDRAPQYQRGVAKSIGPSRLAERRRMGVLLAAIVLTAIALGAGGGGWWTLRTANPPPTMQDVALAMTAFGVLGGIGGFIGGGFLVVGVSAWREALGGARPGEKPPSS